MISMENAVARAFDYFKQLYGSSGVKDPLLEEIELSEDKMNWNVTIGFNTVETVELSAVDAIVAKSGGIGLLSDSKKEIWRKYKLFQINAEDGSLTSMKIKEA